MFIDILNVDEMIRKHGWKEVKVSNYFVPNTSENHPDGLVSNEIFGRPGSPERKTLWGYINLSDYFITPHVFYILSRLKRTIASDMKQGLGIYYIDKHGELAKLEKGKTVPADALVKKTGTGFNWLRDNWENLSWRITSDMSKLAKDQRLLLQTLTKNEVFVNKCPVMPAFYRDVDIKTNKRNKINTDFYAKIIHYSNIIAKTDSFFISDDDPDIPKATSTHIKMQELLMEMYLFFINKCSGANGFINDHVVGKATDYGARLVISSPDINNERWDDCECDMSHSSVPLSIAINIFSPYMIYGFNQWIINYVGGRRFLPYFNKKTGKLEEKELDPSYIDEFDVQKIRKTFNRYKKSKLFRIEPLTFKAMDGTRIPISYFYNNTIDGKPVISIDTAVLDNGKLSSIRYMTYCELFTIIANDVLADKHIFNTRYPVLNYNGTYTSLMNIIPSNKYKEVYVNGMFIKRFPDIDENIKEGEVEHMFTDTMRMYPLYLKALGADYDGDQISTQSVLTEEANQDCEKHMYEMTNVIGLNGTLMREFPAVISQGIYGLTYKIPIPKTV